MGVNLTPIVIRHETSLASLRGRSVAVDGNLELYQFLSIMRMRDGRPLMDHEGRITSHLNGLMFRTTRLLADYGIRPVFVFDGPPPELKRAELARRRETRERAKSDYETAVARGDLTTAWSKAVTATRLTRAMIEDAKTLLSLLGIPVVQAPSEGEAQAAFLARRGDVWAASSKDYDSLLFGAPRLVRFLAVRSTEYLPSRGRTRDVAPERVDLEETLNSLGLTRGQLVDAAILVGTDFFPGIRGIGPKTAVKRVRDWGSLDGAPRDIRDRLPANVEEIRAFFLEPPVETATRLNWKPADLPAIHRFLCEERAFTHGRVEAAVERLHDVRGAQTTVDAAKWATDRPEKP